MSDQSDFWQRPVTHALTVELMPGDQPRVLINREGENVIQLRLSEARALIEVLNVAIGELFILQRDPAALAQVQSLLAEDVTLAEFVDHRRSTLAEAGIGGHIKGHELVRRYRNGERRFPRVDLHLADLEGADLREIDLSGADLTGANLRRANLFYANLEEANLSQSNLEEAGLFQANLRGADLSKATLRGAYLSRADLTGAAVNDEQLTQASTDHKARFPDSLMLD